MVCIYCTTQTDVINSRPQKRKNNVWRRRRCPACGAVFSTIEQADYEKSWVVQYSDGSLRPFLRDKLFTSIYASCQHRPASVQDAAALTGTVLSKLRPEAQNGSIPAGAIARTIHQVLTRFDTVAAVHYQAFHKDVL